MAEASHRRVQTRRSVVRPPPATGLFPRALEDFDTQLMLQARAGSREAANALVRRNSGRIARYLARLVGSRAPVEDLAQDVFVQALTHAQGYQPTARVITWLYRIATNIALNYLKRPDVQRRAARGPDSGAEPPDRHVAAPDRRMSLDELRQAVARAVHNLPVNQRVALTLFEYEDCSYEQIAAILDVSVEAVRSLLTRARATLRGQLQGLV